MSGVITAERPGINLNISTPSQYNLRPLYNLPYPVHVYGVAQKVSGLTDSFSCGPKQHGCSDLMPNCIHLIKYVTHSGQVNPPTTVGRASKLSTPP